MLALADGLYAVHRGSQQGEGGPGVAGAVGLQQAQLFHLLERHGGGAGDGGVDLQ